MTIKWALAVSIPTVLLVTYYFTIGSVKEAEEYDRLSPEESMRRLAQLLPKMDLDGDQNIDRIELKKWILNSFAYVVL